MSDEIIYIPSTTLPGDPALMRKHAFTSWLSRDLCQAAVDFCKNIGLLPIYTECGARSATRYLFWKPPQCTGMEIRSGRKAEQFKKLDKANIEKGWPLLSLHINEEEIYSAVWIAPDRFEEAKVVLAAYGITPAERKHPAA